MNYIPKWSVWLLYIWVMSTTFWYPVVYHEVFVWQLCNRHHQCIFMLHRNNTNKLTDNITSFDIANIQTRSWSVCLRVRKLEIHETITSDSALCQSCYRINWIAVDLNYFLYLFQHNSIINRILLWVIGAWYLFQFTIAVITSLVDKPNCVWNPGREYFNQIIHFINVCIVPRGIHVC